MRLFLFSLTFGCAALIPQIQIALDDLEIREYLVSSSSCGSAEVTITDDGQWSGKDFQNHALDECLTEEPMFCYRRDDRLKLENYLQSIGEYYE